MDIERRKTDMNDELEILDFLIRNYYGWKGLYDYQKDLYWRLSTHPFNVVMKSRQIGISFFYAGFTVLKALQGKKSIIVSPSDRQSKRVMLYIDRWLNGFKAFFDGIDEMTEEHNKSMLRFNNGGEVQALPNSPSNIRGSPSDYLFLDECAHFLHGTDRQIWEAVLPSLTRGEEKSVCVNSTPFGSNNMFYEIFYDRSKFQDFVPVAYHYSECPDINIEDIKRNMDSLSFQQEYELVIISDVDTYYPYSITKPCINTDIEYTENLKEIKTPLYFGVDIGRRQDFTAIVGLTDVGGKLRVVYRKTLKTDEEKAYDNQERILREILNTGKVNRMYIDATGIGNMLSERLAQVYPQVVQFNMTNENKNIMFTSFRKRLEDRGIEYPDDMQLINSLHLIQRMQSGNTVKYDSDKRTDEYGHADEAVALILAAHCYENESVVVGRAKGYENLYARGIWRDGILRGVSRYRKR